MRWYQHKKGFTLIELLVVIAIIVILAAILFPVFAQAKKKAIMNTCINNLKQISSALNMYVNDYDERFPLVTGFGRALDTNTTAFPAPSGLALPRPTDKAWFQYLLLPYVKNDKIFVCPAVGANGKWEALNILFSNNTALDNGAQPVTTYIFNAWVRDPATNTWYMISGQSMGICDRPGDAALIWDAPDGYLVPNGTEAELAHGNAINVAYVDGHVRTLSVPNTTHTDWTQSHFYLKRAYEGWPPPQ